MTELLISDSLELGSSVFVSMVVEAFELDTSMRDLRINERYSGSERQLQTPRSIRITR